MSCYMCFIQVLMFQTNAEVPVTFRATDGKTPPVSKHIALNGMFCNVAHHVQTSILPWRAEVHFGYDYD